MQKSIIHMIKRHWPIVLFCFIYVATALSTYKDYGITADEELQYRAGEVLLAQILGKEPKHLVSERRMPENSTYFLGHTALYSLLNPNGYYEWYHLINSLVALPIFIAIYKGFYLSFRSVWAGMLGIIFLFFIPRFTGHIPSNPKDVPYAVFHFVSLILIFIRAKSSQTSTKNVLLLITALLISITQSLRFLGISLLLIFFIMELIQNKNFLKSVISTAKLSVISFVLMYVFMPIMHHNPVEGLIKIYSDTKGFYEWVNKMLYMGQFLSGNERPWHYLFVWLCIASPLYLLVTNIFAIFRFKELIKHKLFLVSFLSIGINLLLYVLFKPIIYNGLRHFLFLLPLFATTGGMAIVDVFKKVSKFWKYSISAMLFVNLVVIMISFIKLHPYQYIYFNELVGGPKGISMQYETDYWGASYKEGVEKIVQMEKDEKNLKNVYVCTSSFAVQYYSQGKFNVVSKMKNADYILCDKENYFLESIQGEIIYTVKRMDADLLYVVKVRE